MTDLHALALPAADDALTWLTDRCDGELDRARQLVDRLKAAPPTSATDVLQQWNDIAIALGNAGSVSSLMAEVHPQPAVREAAESAMQRVDAFSTDLGLDRDLFDIVSGVATDALEPSARRLHERALRDFRRSGVDRDEGVRARLKELAEQELLTGQEFGRNIREDVRTITVTPEQLAGLPQDWLDSHPAGEDGRVTVTTDYPDAIPVRTFAHDPQTRLAMAEAFLTVGWPANDAVLQRLFALRAEHASVLGYDTWADYDAEVKMIGAGSEIGAFIDRITELSGPSAQRDHQVLLTRKQQDEPGATAVEASDVQYYSEVVRREQYAVDGQLVRTYFDFTRVRQGLLDVTGRLFGLTWQQVEAPVWHEDVAAYDVLRDGRRIGRIYLDLHPREGKYKHAAQFDLVRGVRDRQLPEGVLVCNFNRGLMEHDEVVTLFHEFGHLVHHVLAGEQEWMTFSGVATEWDFVEAPSQMLEEWAWDADVLATFATNAEGETIPADLVHRMREADDFGKGFQARTQMFYAAVSLDFHVARHGDLTARLRQLQAKYSMFPYLAGTHMHTAFGHLDGYSSGYYTYMWSLVIAKDMFSAFDRDDLFAPAVAQRYRDRVLVPGGSKDAAVLVSNFLGRAYTFDAYAAWLAE
ncbi:M3 family metallopeptidase [Luteipulveratus flavus]|uniref:Zn-dependent oligopeptidase n=1 Tax=Luteipulveratus flavus TaxID=3031728 RepID=A0ABT6C4B8_9MICO|nr:M3 family metallopeptidase [Luteipulveratus sp. YIM 133296]MDF8263789.1 Zn-dependent oligopeptidase [Luteipulveratus sp. YIM 133296]